MPSIESIRDFVLEIEKTLSARRFYQPGTEAYQEANERLLKKCLSAAGDEGFNLIFTATDILYDKLSIVSRPKGDQSFFFPLFRDGVRELTFTPGVTASDLGAFMDVLQSTDRKLDPSEASINPLWRRDLKTIIHTIDPQMALAFHQLAEEYWTTRDYSRVAAIMGRLNAAAAETRNPEYRAALADVIRRFLNTERLNILFLDFVGGALPPDIAARLWDLVPDHTIWPILLDSWSHLPDGETRNLVLTALRRRAATNVDLLRQSLLSPESRRVRAVLGLIDEKTERLFARELIQLASHLDEGIRLKGLAAATRLGGPAAVEALWKAMENDPSTSVRLYAFRAMSHVKWPELAFRLEALVTEAHFAERPLWEREKYVRLLASIGGPEKAPLFESWIPSKRWMWQDKDFEMLELALEGLGSTGDAGLKKVRAMSEQRGKPGEVARKVLFSLSRADAGEGASNRRVPTLSNTPLPDEQ